MTPEQIDAFTNAAVNVHAFLDHHGPELLAPAVAGTAWWLMWRRAQRQHRRDAATAEAIRRIEQYANNPDTRRLYDDVHNQPREEEL